MALGDVYQLNVVHILNGRETVNVFYYLETKASVLGEYNLAGIICTEFFAGVYAPSWQPHYTERGRLTALWCKRIFPTVGTANAVPYVDEPGSLGGDSCPNNAAALISFITAVSSANYRRRTYFSGLAESRQVGAEISVVQEFAMRLLGEKIRDTKIIPPTDLTAELTAAAYSKKLAAAGDPAPVKVLTGVGVTRQIRSQRGRNLFTWKKGV